MYTSLLPLAHTLLPHLSFFGIPDPFDTNPSLPKKLFSKFFKVNFKQKKPLFEAKV